MLMKNRISLAGDATSNFMNPLHRMQCIRGKYRTLIASNRKKHTNPPFFLPVYSHGVHCFYLPLCMTIIDESLRIASAISVNINKIAYCRIGASNEWRLDCGYIHQINLFIAQNATKYNKQTNPPVLEP